MVALGTVAAVVDRLGGMSLPVAAHELAKAGVPVFPCVPGEKNPIVPFGFKLATTSLRRVDGWWRWQPHANIGIPTGHASGLVVIDVDVHRVNGYAAYARAARTGLIGEPLVTVTTPTGGQHAYFPATPTRTQGSWAIGRVGVDCRGDGGYIIAPPSMLHLDHGSAAYRVERVATGPAVPVDAGRLRAFLSPPPRPRPAPDGPRRSGWVDADRLAAWLARQIKGDRNLKLFWAACRLAEDNVPVSQALDALVKAEKDDFREREITRTVYSAYRNVGAAGPRRSAPSAHGAAPRAPDRAAPSGVPVRGL